MKVLGIKKLHDFRLVRPDSQAALDSRLAEAEAATWKNHHDVKVQYSTASILPDKHVVFNICGNKYRLDTKIDYQEDVILIVRIGTHREYDAWTF